MVITTDPEPEKCEVKILPLVRRVDPAHETDQDGHEGKHAKGINLNNDGLAPHESVEGHQHAGHTTGDDTKSIFPLPLEVFEFRDALEEHAAAARNHERDHAAGEGSSEGRG